MSRKWLRLIAWVSVVAFIAANTHAGTTATRFLSAPSPARPAQDLTATTAEPAGADTPAPRCKHCARKASAASPETPRAEPEQDRCPCGPSCPGCPEGPSCPCPGGCALCNVCKVPCLALTPTFLFALPCLGEGLAEVPHLYTPPSAGRLIRPPKV